MKLLEKIMPTFPTKTNSLDWIFQQESSWTKNLGFIFTKWSLNVRPTGEFLGVFGYLIENKYRPKHQKFVSV
jgi:hypothetical protein